jgi:hypothetical protein
MSIFVVQVNFLGSGFDNMHKIIINGNFEYRGFNAARIPRKRALPE